MTEERYRGSKPKILYIYPTLIKLGKVIPYLKEIQNICISQGTLLEFCWHHHFMQFSLHRGKNKSSILTQDWDSFDSNWIFQSFLINVLGVLMMSAKLTTPGFLNVFWKISFWYGFKKEILKLYLHAVMWPKFGNSRIFITEVRIASILYGFYQKTGSF